MMDKKRKLFSLRLFQITIFLYVMMIPFSNQQGLVTKGKELWASAYGRNQSLLTLLYEAPEVTYSIDKNGESLSNISQNVYGTDQYTDLLIYGNPQITWNHNIDTKQAGNKIIKAPYIFDCLQYVGIDCVYHSYNKSIVGPLNDKNYWKKVGTVNYKPNIAWQLTTVMSYPAYFPFIMTHLWHMKQNPETTLTIKIKNMLPFDLESGKLSLEYGRGPTPPSKISYNEEISFTIAQSDILHGIVGKLSYQRPTFWSTGYHDCEFSFRIHVGNGTLPNYANISFPQFSTHSLLKIHSQLQGVNQWYGDSTWGVHYRASITDSPDAQLKIWLAPYYNQERLITSGSFRRVSVGNLRLEADTTENSVAAFMGSSSTLNKIAQNWKLLMVSPVQFRFISAKNDDLCLEADPLLGRVALRKTLTQEDNQIWTLIDTSNAGDAYLLKAYNADLCLHVNPSLNHEGQADYRFIMLEKCNPNEPNQVWTLTISQLQNLNYS